MNESEQLKAARECGISQMRLGMMSCGYSQSEIERVTAKAKDFHSRATSATIMALFNSRALSNLASN